MSRSPRGQRPRKRTILVFVQVSSMNTSRAGSNMPCRRIQRRRSRATSVRFCSAAYRLFFKADVVPFIEPPDRCATSCDASSRHSRNNLIQRHIRPLDGQSEEKLGMFIKRRGAATARPGFNTSARHPTLHPDHHNAGTDPVKLGRLAPRCPPSTVSITRIRNSCEYGFGIGPPEIEINADRLAHRLAFGNPQFNPTGNR